MWTKHRDVSGAARGPPRGFTLRKVPGRPIRQELEPRHSGPNFTTPFSMTSCPRLPLIPQYDVHNIVVVSASATKAVAGLLKSYARFPLQSEDWPTLVLSLPQREPPACSHATAFSPCPLSLGNCPLTQHHRRWPDRRNL